VSSYHWSHSDGLDGAVVDLVKNLSCLASNAFCKSVWLLRVPVIFHHTALSFSPTGFQFVPSYILSMSLVVSYHTKPSVGLAGAVAATFTSLTVTFQLLPLTVNTHSFDITLLVISIPVHSV
jgi:prepilin signal peptidase PulO-like enzyme (type II secretory pathway)